MLGIHTVYTPVNRRGTGKIHDMMQFESLAMILSALCWKQFQGPIKLYCDKDFYDYITLLGVTDLWDEIDTETLNHLEPNVNHNTFWAYSKMYINSLQTEPFVSLDIDLFQTQGYDYTSHDVIFSHIEKTDSQFDNLDNFSRYVYYPDYHEWDIFKDRFSNYPDIKISDKAMNVGILAINKPELYRDFFAFINSFVKNNSFDPQDITTHGFERIFRTIHSSSLITFVEQRLLYAYVNSLGYSAKSILNLTYNAGDQVWEDEHLGMNNPNITHLWGWKVTYRTPEHENDRLSLTDNLLETLNTMFHDSYVKYIDEGNILKYCKK
jgi:hypothetical protein